MSENGPNGQARSIAIDVQQLTAGDTVVRLSGDMVGDAAALMHQTLVHQLSRSPSRLIVNLSEVSRIDACGIAALASAAAVAGEADHAFCLVDREAGRVHAALTAKRVTDLFEIFSSVSEALQNPG